MGGNGFAAIRASLGAAGERAVVEHDILVAAVAPDGVRAAAEALKRAGCDILLDVTATDWLPREPRFDVVWHFYSTGAFVRVRLKAQVPGSAPAVDSLAGVYGAAEYIERECHEMYGIAFRGNRDLRPILLYEGFVGHPLRKDYDKLAEQPLIPMRDPLAERAAAAAAGESAAVLPSREPSPLPEGPMPNPVRPAFDRASREDRVVVNIGPSHPATHGTVQIIAELEGEKILRVDVHCGYLHRGFEKECESHTWHNLIPYVDRLNYCSALINNFAYVEGVEKLMGIAITRRCVVLRTLLSEYSRLADHLTCIAASLMELGAMTAFLYLVMLRDWIYEHLADLTGARVTYSYGRIGGLARDLPDGWLDRLEWILGQYDEFVGRVHGLVDRNRIFIDRMRDVGVLTQAEALDYGYTGPLLRSTGLPRDLRKDTPYLAYAELDFEVPVGIKGDNYDRYYVRMREMDESVHMIRQCVDLLPDGPVDVDDRRCTFPPKPLVYKEIESLINHFKLVIDGPVVPAGEVYTAHESPNGELGFFLVSNGSGTPHKVHVRAPSFVHLGGLHRMIVGDQLADIVPTFGSVNMIGGECDR
ncbi:MAG: NADH dehydrogenase (quinone) subunit D [Betaproteobacteria bacterium]|nr:NADH dehydrogenase (quinone) subunit D [Betaproteobacteria bacterium]